MKSLASERLDKWLWAARFYKTRSLAQEQIAKGRVQVKAGVDWQTAKPGRELHGGDILKLQINTTVRELRVISLTLQRGPASQAQAMYEESAESIERREKEQAARKLAPMPGAIAGWHEGKGRPTKRDRREQDSVKLKLSGERFDW
jgi:ribosome-associated heat shock protein Hsp15